MPGPDEERPFKIVSQSSPPAAEEITAIVTSTSTSSATVAYTTTVVAVEFPKQHVRPPEDHEIYSLVGRVASEWARLEYMLDLILADLAPLPPPRMACITAQLMGIWPRINSLIAILTQRSIKEPNFEKYIKQVRSLGEDSRDISERRNRIIHDPWYVDPNTEATGQQKSMPRQDKNYRLQYGIKDVNRKEIDETLSEIARLTKRANQLRDALLGEIKP
jgi:hypothetical protein